MGNGGSPFIPGSFFARARRVGRFRGAPGMQDGVAACTIVREYPNLVLPKLVRKIFFGWALVLDGGERQGCWSATRGDAEALRRRMGVREVFCKPVSVDAVFEAVSRHCSV